MRIAFITSGAAGMYCGSCMKDNTLAAALIAQGHDALLIPTYTPIRTDEADVSERRVFFGGINVYLEQKSRIFRHTPWFVDRLLNFPRLLRWVSRFAVKTEAEALGALTVSMLKGDLGKQRKEIAKLLGFLKDEVKPDVVVLSNLLISGLVAEVKKTLNVPIIGTMQGDDIYLESLPVAYRTSCVDLIRENCKQIDGYIATSAYYANFMAAYLKLPLEDIRVVYPGIKSKGIPEPSPVREHPPFTIGYFARICPEKGFHQLVDAFMLLRKMPNAPACKLRVSGWLGENNRAFFDGEMAKLDKAGLRQDVEHVPSPDHSGKIDFFRSLDLLSVPTVYREPKGIYILEALANGVPVVQPRHGSFTELIEATGGGILVEPNNPQALAVGLKKMLEDTGLRRQCRDRGRASVLEKFTSDRMADSTLLVLEEFLG